MNTITKQVNPEADLAAAVERVAVYCRQRFAADGRKPLAHILTLGCQQNEADSEKIAGMAVKMGYGITENPEDAALIVVNTCAIREHAEQRALSLIGRFKYLKTQDPERVLAVCGCMPSQEHRAEELKRSYPYVDLVFGTAALAQFPLLLAAHLEEGRRQFCPGTGAVPPDDMPAVRGSSFKAWVAIMYGCNNFCSYCIVPYVRGRERSRSAESILREVCTAVGDGYREITLLGQNVNSYGNDTGGEERFPQLLARLAQSEGDFWLRFMTSHPKDVSDELIAVMAANEKIARHFHLPLQSGSDPVLSRMNRRYTAQHYLQTVDKLRAAMPDISITSDVIVGFPGETEEDFAATLDVVQRAAFDMIYPFQYSPRKGTPAAALPDQIPDEIKHERFERLLALQNDVSLSRNRRFVGREIRVLTEGESSKPGFALSGRTSGAKLVHLTGEAQPGRFVIAQITNADTFALYGKIIETCQ